MAVDDEIELTVLLVTSTSCHEASTDMFDPQVS